VKKFTPIEWQSFSLKKDIEIIVGKLQDNHFTQISLLGEISLVILGVALSNIFTDIAKQQCFWIILSVLSIIPFLIIGLRWIHKRLEENKPGSDQMNPRDFINAFDNEIAYYVLMSESYYTMLTEAVLHNNTHTDKVSNDMIHFYYIQASYYFKKTIADLAPICNIADRVLSTNEDNIATKRLISFPRYNNVKNLLITISDYLESQASIMKDLDDGEIIVNLNKTFRDNLDRIDRAILESLKPNKGE
jgi:hypothetical protein